MVGLPSTRVARMMEAWRVAEMVHALPAEVHNPKHSSLVQQACLECLFTHTRALIEFLDVRSTKHRDDFSASDICDDWSLRISSEHREILQRYWTTASQHVMHFSTGADSK